MSLAINNFPTVRYGLAPLDFSKISQHGQIEICPCDAVFETDEDSWIKGSLYCPTVGTSIAHFVPPVVVFTKAICSA
jgi:hypothetical protein